MKGKFEYNFISGKIGVCDGNCAKKYAFKINSKFKLY